MSFPESNYRRVFTQDSRAASIYLHGFDRFQMRESDGQAREQREAEEALHRRRAEEAARRLELADEKMALDMARELLGEEDAAPAPARHLKLLYVKAVAAAFEHVSLAGVGEELLGPLKRSVFEWGRPSWLRAVGFYESGEE